MAPEFPLTLSPDSSRLSPEPKAEEAQELPGMLTCRIETSFKGLDGIREAWDDAVIRLGGTIYMSYDWVRTWWDFYGAGNDLRLFVFSSGNRVVGIVPLYVATLGFWPLRFKVARLVGANIPPKVFNPPIDEKYVDRILRHLLARILDAEKCHLLSLGPVSELYGQHILKAVRNHDTRDSRITLRTCGVHSVFGLPASYEEYFRSLTKKERKNNKNRYDLSLLKKDHAAHEEVVSDTARVETEYEPFVRLHTQEWQQKGGSGHFLSWPKGKEFNGAVLRAQAARGRAEFVRIVADGNTIASVYGYYLGNTFFAELLGRELKPEWDKYNLGRAILVRAVAQAIRRGCKVVDAGLGHYDYKERLSAQEHAVFQIRCWPARLDGRFLRWLFDAVRVALLVLYRKIWYRRIRKRLPLRFRKPQAGLWLRFDF